MSKHHLHQRPETSKTASKKGPKPTFQKARGGTQPQTGIISINARGTGFVRIPEQTEDIIIHKEDLNTALHGDQVEVIIRPKRKYDRLNGEVVNVVHRAKTRFVGVLQKRDGVWFLDPDDRRMYVDIVLHPKSADNAQEGYKAYVEMTKWSDDRKAPLGKLIEVIGPHGEHETEMRSVVLAAGFDYQFPHEVEEAANAIQAAKARFFEEEIKRRRDMRSSLTFTIDPYDAKDFDDAISVTKLPNGNIELGVHIADVSAYVKENDAIDKEAVERGTSIYLVDRTIPMLPEVLSNDVCSLNPNEDKLAFSVVYEFDQKYSIVSEWFGETVIKSDKRFTYEEAQEILDKDSGVHIEELRIARDIARKLRDDRFKAGSIAFETEEIKFKLDEKGVPLQVIRKERRETNLLIEDLMLAANRSVASYVTRECSKEKEQPCAFVYRVHDRPNPEKIVELSIFLEAIGFELKHTKGEVTPDALNALFKSVEGSPIQDVIETAAVRSMAKAIYTTKNIGHFGLAFTHYCHFTSPIRRYPDLMVHRILKQVLAGRGTPSRDIMRIERLAQQSSEREVAAAEAERESVKYKQVEYMSKHIGEIFDGVITGVTDFGIFVEEVETKAEGLIRLRDLPSDYYELDEHGYHIVGTKTQAKFGLCDKVKIKLIGTDLEQKMINWQIIKK